MELKKKFRITLGSGLLILIPIISLFSEYLTLNFIRGANLHPNFGYLEFLNVSFAVILHALMLSCMVLLATLIVSKSLRKMVYAGAFLYLIFIIYFLDAFLSVSFSFLYPGNNR